MADAGRILIMPKGTYDETTSYERLDLVKHNDIVWLAKKDVIGIEPSLENEEYWFELVDTNADTLDGHHAEEFLQTTGGTMTGVPIFAGGVNGVDGGEIKFKAPESETVITSANVTMDIRGNNLRIMGETGDVLPIFNFDFSGVNGSVKMLHTGNGLPLTGGTIAKASSSPLSINNTTSGASEVWLGLATEGTNKLLIGAKDGKPYLYGDKGGEILHTGNKPTGSYTGNGSATERTISTGGIGSVLYLTGIGWGVFAHAKGAIVTNADGRTIATLPASEVIFSNGVLTIKTTNERINGSGTTYNYQVL